MIEENICPVCGSVHIRHVETLTDYPAIVFPVDSETIETIDTKDLLIYVCDGCSHIFQRQVDDIFNEKIYTDYYRFYPYSNIECFVEHYRKPFENVMIYLQTEMKKKNRLLEIGVSSSAQLDFFKKTGFEPLGITPQTIEEENIVSSFYEEYDFREKFNVIVSRFNLEHIVNLGIFMEKVAHDLEENGLFVVQVPNTSDFINENILNFYAHEHIHYFNKKSLASLFERYGFSIEVLVEHNSPSIIIVGRNSSRSDLSLENYKRRVVDTEDKIAKILDTHKNRVVLYGASLSLTKLIYGKCLKSFKESDLLIIDDNPIIEGMYMPLFHKEITPFNKADIREGDIIILTLNAIYHEVVIKKIRANGFKNKVYCINHNGLEEV